LKKGLYEPHHGNIADDESQNPSTLGDSSLDMHRRHSCWWAVSLILFVALASSPFSTIEGFAPVPRRSGPLQHLAFVAPGTGDPHKKITVKEQVAGSDRWHRSRLSRLQAGGFVPAPVSAVMVIY
jgi:hypothetical protein